MSRNILFQQGLLGLGMALALMMAPLLGDAQQRIAAAPGAAANDPDIWDIARGG